MNTETIVEYARRRFDHESAKRLLKEKYQSKMIFAHAGGMWCAGPELQITLMSCPDSTAVILDLYQNPVKVDTKELFRLSQQLWQEQMNAWLIEFQQIQN
jgi:hypothetical protein